MNPLKNFYEVIDVLKENKTGKVFLVYDKTGKQVCVLKERNLKTAEIYKSLKKIKNPYWRCILVSLLIPINNVIYYQISIYSIYLKYFSIYLYFFH